MTDHLAELARTRDATLPYFDADYAVQTRSYAPGKWDMRRFLLHLADCESVYLDRLRRLAADEQPLLWVFDENRWSEQLQPELRSLRMAADLFRANRDAVIELCRLSPPATWSRAGVHNIDGRRTFEETVTKIWRHNAHHLEQLAAIAAGKPWQPRAPTTAAQGLAMNDADAIPALERTRDQVLPFFKADAATLARAYAPGKWSMRQVLLHLVDQEQLYLDRLRRVAADDQPLLWDTVADHWTQRLFSDRRSLETAAALYRATRDSAIELARLAPPETWAREGVHVGIGKLSFARLLAMIHGHTENHLEHLRAIAAGRLWAAR